jgi:hypothetical protein
LVLANAYVSKALHNKIELQYNPLNFTLVDTSPTLPVEALLNDGLAAFALHSINWAPGKESDTHAACGRQFVFVL